MIGALRHPLLHFVLLGGALFAARTWWEPVRAPRARPRLVVAAEDVRRAREEWAGVTGHAPGPHDDAALVDRLVDEQVLFREALAAGLERGDGLARTRLDDLRRFLGESGEGGGDPARGLAAQDVVIRRHLVSLMRLALSRPDATDAPDDAALARFLADHAAEFEQPPRWRLTHVYLSRDRHGPALERDAQALLDELRRTRAEPAPAGDAGEPFLHGAHLDGVTPGDLDRLFGPGFAGALRDAPAARWVGPVRSTYGMHLVWVHERTAPGLPTVEAVRAQLTHRLLDGRGRARARARLDRLRTRYEVVVER